MGIISIIIQLLAFCALAFLIYWAGRQQRTTLQKLRLEILQHYLALEEAFTSNEIVRQRNLREFRVKLQKAKQRKG